MMGRKKWEMKKEKKIPDKDCEKEIVYERNYQDWHGWLKWRKIIKNS